ncbi:unnamed protein product [Toxocara canis]|uniref:Rhomboid domain-containing protein n=1 Tax=Toxocara canis TaxID=6265 RepID=A0A183UYE5_TOXCA|nr:unnamed protein product [Toxocara canis]
MGALVSQRFVASPNFADKSCFPAPMMRVGRAQYQMQNQNWFRYTPITKAWICSLLSSSTTYMYVNMYSSSPLTWVPSLSSVLEFKGMAKLLLSKLFFGTPSLLITGIVLLYYGRWVERRFGSKKFINFIFIVGIQSAILEVSMYYAICRLFGYEPSTMFFAPGPFTLLSAVYANFIFEIPVLIGGSRSSLIACIAGLVSGLLYRSGFMFIREFDFVPSFIVRTLQSTSNPFGWLTQKFVNCGEDNRSVSVF